MGVDTSPEAIAALLDGVTPGPWKYVTNGKKSSITDCDYDRLFIASGTTAPYCDARFIAAARELVPALAAEIARLTAERDRLVMALAETEALEEQHGEVIKRLTAERDAAWNAAILAAQEVVQQKLMDLAHQNKGMSGLAHNIIINSEPFATNATLALLKPEEQK
jgi:hypothetical protein